MMTIMNISHSTELIEMDSGTDNSRFELINFFQLDEAINRTKNFLLDCQSPEGYWVGELEADPSVSAGYIPLMYFMHGKLDATKTQKIINYVQSKQRSDGSWSAYHDGPGDINVSIQVYFALKLAGVPAAEPWMGKARDFITHAGGVSCANVFTKIWLALFGQVDWLETPSIPPEIIFLPKWFYFNIYEFASWSRATIMALSVVLTQKPICDIPEYANINELIVEKEDTNNRIARKTEKFFSWRNFFNLMDFLFKAWERLPVQPGRKQALQRTVDWIIKHQEADGSWGGIMLPWIYSLYALKCLDYPLDHPAIQRGIEGLEGFTVEDELTFRLQPAVSPVWDTAWSIISLSESGLEDDHQALVLAGNWLLEQEIKIAGDWQFKNPNTEPGGWAFEFENDQYPDIDDSALVPRALNKIKFPRDLEEAKQNAIQRAVKWVLDMQSKDGGWAAFDRDNNKKILSQVPFADFMSPLDPTCADVTAHVIELLVEMNHNIPSLYKAIAFLIDTQEEDGAWYGRWGVNYLYGTSLALESLSVAGGHSDQESILRAVEWLKLHQNKDGGWGEICRSYVDSSLRGSGVSTASQTAWAVIAMIAAGEVSSVEVSQGIQYLLRTQHADGRWPEALFTGTGFPKVFYLRYDYYRIYFPLIALARYKESQINWKLNEGALHTKQLL